MSEFLMPSLGADIQFGTIIDWRVKPGDAVKLSGANFGGLHVG